MWALAAKDEQIKTKDLHIDFLDRLNPSNVVEHVEKLKSYYEERLQHEETVADATVEELAKVSRDERAELQHDLEQSRGRIAELEQLVQTSNAMLAEIQTQARYEDQEWLEDGWRQLLRKLNPKLRAYYKEGRPALVGKRLVLVFPYGFHHNMALEHAEEVVPLISEWLGENYQELELKLKSAQS